MPLILKSGLIRQKIKNGGITVTVKEIMSALQADLLCGENKLSQECLAGCGCDLMSDVLAFPKEHMCLLTGLTNAHVVRTCEMLDVVCIVFVRGKQPPADALELARELGIAVMSTSLTLYEACGKLYALGLPGKNTL